MRASVGAGRVGVCAWWEQKVGMCAIEARLCLLRERNTTGSEVVKTAPDLSPKGGGGQEHGVRKAKRDKYLSRVGQLGRLW